MYNTRICCVFMYVCMCVCVNTYILFTSTCAYRHIPVYSFCKHTCDGDTPSLHLWRRHAIFTSCSQWYILTSCFQCYLWRGEGADSLFQGGDGTQGHSARGARRNRRGKPRARSDMFETVQNITLKKCFFEALTPISVYVLLL
jgi:hypothetical protein